MKPTLKTPGTMRLKLEYDGPPSKFALKSSLRRYSVVQEEQHLGAELAVEAGLRNTANKD
jgi:hypothetical protein